MAVSVGMDGCCVPSWPTQTNRHVMVDQANMNPSTQTEQTKKTAVN